MHVKKLRLVGFKSFADETTILLDKGITAIVGPNGCGKSNIVDAVRWALGEKSSRALRGKNMEDVIFLGSERRKPAGMAEVEIHFDNTDRTLPLEVDEVIIGRRIYLNTNSEYYINGKKATRKEIENIFLDTGIGKTAYSIMEQGKMDEILKASPEERRFLFDEAAGISRFKSEKQETLKRLEDTKQNLLRLQDILKEKEKELSQLEKQARKTKQYLTLKERLDKHDLNLRYLKYVSLKEKEQIIGEKLKQLLSEKNQIFHRINAIEMEIEELEKKNQEELELLQKMEIEFHQQQNLIEQKKQEIERITNEEKFIKQKIEQIENRIKNEMKYQKNIESKYQESLQIELDLGNEIESIKNQISQAENQIKELNHKLESITQTEESNQKELDEIEEKLANEFETLKKLIEDFIQELQNRQEELKKVENQQKEWEAQIYAFFDELEKDLAEIKELIQKKEFTSTPKILDKISVSLAKKHFEQYKKINQEFRNFLFGEKGILSQKEEIDIRMRHLNTRKTQLQKENKENQKIKQQTIRELEKIKNQKQEWELSLKDFEIRRFTSVETRDSIKTQLQEIKERLNFLNDEKASYEHQMAFFKEQREKHHHEISKLKHQMEEINTKIKQLKKQTKEWKEKIHFLKKETQKEREKIEKILPEITSYERQEENLRVALNTLEEELYHDFQMSPTELIHKCEHQKLDYEKEHSEYQRLKAEIQALGQFNALAIEQYEASKKAYEELMKQKNDIENSEKNIREILERIDQESKKLFLETFEKIQKNFEEVFKTLFGGGSAQITLSDPNNPLESGIQIFAQPPGKKNTYISLLSGGEQSLTAIALMFAIYLVKPSPFCLLDEIDAPLDDNNIRRFLSMLKQFTKSSQFVVITHNKLTMAEANVIFGVTQEEPGVSKVISVKLDNLKHQHV
ncbi:MAG: AAA family ATPase [Leptospiraceae bacterium]|nr:AAA family ATPase [Leptospiraceae bacterium]MDW7975642.1 AAA family ATPase [Leptospiraceae bacterium]